MTQVSWLQWDTYSDCDSTDIQSSGNNKHYIQIPDEDRVTICVHLNGANFTTKH